MAPGEAQGAAWPHGGGGTSEHLVWILPSRWESSARPSCLQPRAGSAESWNRQLRAGQKNLCAQRPRRAQRLPARHKPSFSPQKTLQHPVPDGTVGTGTARPTSCMPKPLHTTFLVGSSAWRCSREPGRCCKAPRTGQGWSPGTASPLLPPGAGILGRFFLYPVPGGGSGCASRGLLARGGGLPPPPARGWVTPSQQKGMQLWGGFKGL